MNTQNTIDASNMHPGYSNSMALCGYKPGYRERGF